MLTNEEHDICILKKVLTSRRTTDILPTTSHAELLVIPSCWGARTPGLEKEWQELSYFVTVLLCAFCPAKSPVIERSEGPEEIKTFGCQGVGSTLVLLENACLL